MTPQALKCVERLCDCDSSPCPPQIVGVILSLPAHSLSYLQITLLKYFRNYMSEHLLKAGANITPREGDELARLPYLCTWFRTRSAIILHLSNGTVQINFFQVRLLLCVFQGCSSSCCKTPDMHGARCKAAGGCNLS